MNGPNPYKDFTDRLKLLSSKHPDLITTTLSNVFTMRLIGNKTHGDLAEIAIAEFINQYMYDFNPLLVELFSHALVSSSAGHTAALTEIKEDIARLRRGSGMAT